MDLVDKALKCQLFLLTKTCTGLQQLYFGTSPFVQIEAPSWVVHKRGQKEWQSYSSQWQEKVIETLATGGRTFDQAHQLYELPTGNRSYYRACRCCKRIGKESKATDTRLRCAMCAPICDKCAHSHLHTLLWDSWHRFQPRIQHPYGNDELINFPMEADIVPDNVKVCDVLTFFHYNFRSIVEVSENRKNRMK